MNKKLILFPICLFSLILAGCTGITSSTSVPTSESRPVSGSTGGSDASSTSKKTNQTYNFYLDYNHSENPYYMMRWYTSTPLGECPEYCKNLGPEKAGDPTFSIFLGWSIYSGCLDETLLWNFATDSRMATTVNLYGVWVSE